MVDDQCSVACSVMLAPEDRKTREGVANWLIHELDKPTDPRELFEYEREQWGLDAPSGQAFGWPSFNDPGDGAI